MSMKKDQYNIYSIDDVLIKVGYVFLVLFILTGGTAISNMVKQVSTDQSASLQTAAALLLVPASVFLLVGYGFRRKERVAAAILHKMELAREAPVTDLMKSAGYSRRMVEQALVLINRRGLGYYVLDRGTDRIVDGRLRRNMVLVDRCDRCGSGISKSFPASQTEPPHCPYCGSPVGIDRWNDMRHSALEDIMRQDAMEIPAADTGQPSATASRGRASFSLPLFILLLLLFWPAAIVYAVSRYNK
jgi:hypothetical protein